MLFYERTEDLEPVRCILDDLQLPLAPQPAGPSTVSSGQALEAKPSVPAMPENKLAAAAPQPGAGADPSEQHEVCPSHAGRVVVEVKQQRGACQHCPVTAP